MGGVVPWIGGGAPTLDKGYLPWMEGRGYLPWKGWEGLPCAERVLATRRAVCLLRLGRRTILLKMFLYQ